MFVLKRKIFVLVGVFCIGSFASCGISRSLDSSAKSGNTPNPPTPISSLCHTVNCVRTDDVLSNNISQNVFDKVFNTEESCAKNNNEGEVYQSQQIDILDDHITIHSRTITPKPTAPRCKDKFKNSYFYSGRINTENKYTITKDESGNLISKGGVEVTARVPFGKGLWPAIWMLPLNLGWPTGMEIDILEIQKPDNPASAGSTVHYGDGSQHLYNRSGNGTDGLFKPTISDTAYNPQVFHNYGFTWSCETTTESACGLSWYLDGKNYLTLHLDADKDKAFIIDSNGLKKDITNHSPVSGYKNPSDPANAAYTSWWKGFKQGYYLILNVAVGGDGLGVNDQPNYETFQDSSMDIKSIKRFVLN